MFAEHDVERVYHAIVLGSPRARAGTLESRLRERPDGIMESVRRGGSRAVTHYETIADHGSWSVVACQLETGRRNQIRVQFADIGHAIAGDRKYGHRNARFRSIRAPRTMLHATGIAFTHPITGARIEVLAKFPQDFRAFLGNELCDHLDPSAGA